MKADEEIKRLSLIDAAAQHPTLRLSVVEEIGEIARAINVETGGYGKSGKTLDEPSYMECVDLYICAMGLLYLDGDDTGAEEHPGFLPKSIDDNMKMLLLDTCNGHWKSLAKYAFLLYARLGGKVEHFESNVLAKLAKWEKNLG